jgi:DNA recombination protein RmuC
MAINLTVLIVILLVIVLCLLILLTLKSFRNNASDPIKQFIEQDSIRKQASEKQLREDLMNNRLEMVQSGKDLRLEVMQQIATLSKTLGEASSNTADMQYKQLHQFSEQMYQMMQTNTERHVVFQNNIDKHHVESKQELSLQLNNIKREMQEALKDYKTNLRENFSDFSRHQSSGSENINEKLGDIKKALEGSIKTLQDSNEKKLEQMRHIVDEKLNSTLEKRLGESYRIVSERLEAVHKGLGDMQNLALSVGDLKKVMSNVKSRGIIGEYQLQNILEDLLTNEQYGKNVKTKEGSGAHVEFAIKMPNGPQSGKSLWLPIDAKFPREDFEALLTAYETALPELIEKARKAFAGSIIKNAKDIQEKYLDPPNTTEYGLMFLPFESLYAEVLCIPGLFEKLQKEYKITITGPTTLSALLNSLQMGFRTLAIEKRSTEVWDLLGSMKTEFNQFGALLDKTKKKLDEAANVIDTAGVRSRAIQRKLNKVDALNEDNVTKLLEIEDDFSHEIEVLPE